MHFFGRLLGCCRSEYLCTISIERIKRECAAISRISIARAFSPEATHDERAAAFCESAVFEFGRKLERIAAEESERSKGPTEQVAARDEAKGRPPATRNARRTGGRGTQRGVRHSAAVRRGGQAHAGRAGLDSRSVERPRQLPRRSRLAHETRKVLLGKDRRCLETRPNASLTGQGIIDSLASASRASMLRDAGHIRQGRGAAQGLFGGSALFTSLFQSMRPGACSP